MRPAVSSHLAFMLILTTIVFAAGAAQKAPCASASWVEHRQGIHFVCDSDIPNLYLWEQLGDRSLPYIDPCRPLDRPCDEYPVVTMYVMRAVAAFAGDGIDPYAPFYWAAAVLLLGCALIVTWLLERVGARTVLFAAAPILAVAGTANWDLVPVALTTAATAAFIARRDLKAGVLLGLGAATKLYPGLIVVPFAAQRHRDGHVESEARIVGGAVATWLACNLPFAILAFQGWWTFFRYNAERGADFTSLWAVVCRWIACPSPSAMNLVSFAVAVVGIVWVWSTVERRHPGTPRWIMGFPILVVFLITGKVWAAHYGLWLLPWFALTAVPAIQVLEYQLAEVAVYLVAYHYFGTVNGGEGVSYEVLALVVIIRACLLLRCLVSWIRDPFPVVSSVERARRGPAPASA